MVFQESVTVSHIIVQWWKYLSNVFQNSFSPKLKTKGHIFNLFIFQEDQQE